MKLNSSTFVFFVILQVVLAFTFITVFFFTYGKILEKQAIMNNIDYLIESVIGNNMLELDDNTKNLIISNIMGNTANGINVLNDINRIDVINNIENIIDSIDNKIEIDENTKKTIMNSITNFGGNTSNNGNNSNNSNNIKSTGDTGENNPDINVDKNNKKIFKNSMIILSIILFLVILLFVFFMSMRNSSISFFQNFEFIKIFKESMIILVFVALTEFCFLYFFGRKYIVIEKNELKRKVLWQLYLYSHKEDYGL
jgi:hypothetical protein